MSRVSRFLFSKKGTPVRLSQSIEVPACTNCGTEISGPYCGQCGQKKEHEHDITIWHFLAHSLHEFVHFFDSRFFNTIKYLLFKPGYLTEEYIAGHRKKYINPVRLFLIINIIYLLLTGLDTFTTPLEIHVHDRYQKIVRPLVASKLKETGLTFTEYAKLFDEKTKGQAESMIVIMVLAFSVVMSLLYYRQHRYFLEHLVFSFGFYSVILVILSVGVLVFNVLLYAVILLVEKIKIATGNLTVAAANKEIQSILYFISHDAFLVLFFGGITTVTLFASLKRVYRESNFTTFIKTILAFAGIWYIMLGYRLVLFFTTYYTLRVH